MKKVPARTDIDVALRLPHLPGSRSTVKPPLPWGYGCLGRAETTDGRGGLRGLRTGCGRGDVMDAAPGAAARPSPPVRPTSNLFSTGFALACPAACLPAGPPPPHSPPHST